MNKKNGYISILIAGVIAVIAMIGIGVSVNTENLVVGGNSNIAPLPVRNFLGLTDSPDTYTGQANKIVSVNAGETALEFTTNGAGATTFLTLTDTPSAYTGQGTKFVRVNAGESALEFATVSGGGDALTSAPLSQFAATTSLELKGVISDETGSGALVFANTPTLVTPVLGSATGTALQLSGLTASQILATDGSKNLVSLAVATYPSLTELSYVKGLTSALQTQLNGKANTALSNLASVAINTTLISDTDNTDSLGTTAITWSDLFLGSGSVIQWNTSPSTSDATLTHSSNQLTLAGASLALGSNSLALTGSISTTGARVTKIWTTDIESTNMITVNGTSLSSTFAPLTSPTFATSITGSYLTASEMLITDGSKNIVSAPVATYPSLTELSYLKGATSAVQTQINAKSNSSGSLTQFVGNTAWRVFYSDSLGDITELALGADGTFLKSNGATSAPSFATPSGSGDVSKVGTPVNNQVGVWTGDGTIEGDTNLTFDTTTDTLTSVNINATTFTGALTGNASTVTNGVYTTGAGTVFLAPNGSAASLTSFPTLNQNTTGSAATLTTPRAIYGNNFDGSASLTQVIASTYGGTGNGFTKFTGATTAEKTYTLPDSNATLLYSGGALGTPSAGTLTNATGLPAAGVVGTAAVLGTANLFSVGGHTITVANTANVAGLTINQNDTTNNLSGLKIVSSVSPNLSSSYPLIIENTNTGSNGSFLLTYHNSSSPLANDYIGGWDGFGKDSAGNDHYYAGVNFVATNVTNTTESGAIAFLVASGGLSADARLWISATTLHPETSDGMSLGSTTKQFSDLFLAEGGVINWDNGDLTLTQTGNVLKLAGGVLETEGNIELGHASANTLSASAGDLSIEGNVIYRAGGTDIPLTDTAITAGRSLTISTNDILADAELYTDTKCIYIEDPVAADDLKSLWYSKQASTITSIWCESDQTVTAMLQVDDGTAADVDGTDLTCDTTPPEDTSLDGDATMASGDRLDLDLASVSGTPTWVSICFTFTYDD